MSLGHEHGLVLIGLAGPMYVVNLSLPLSLSPAMIVQECPLIKRWPVHHELCTTL